MAKDLVALSGEQLSVALAKIGSDGTMIVDLRVDERTHLALPAEVAVALAAELRTVACLVHANEKTRRLTRAEAVRPSA